MHNKLREIRKQKGYSMRELGIFLGISKAFYSQIENEKRGLSYELAYKISRIFKTKPDNLFYDEYKEKEMELESK